MKCLSSTFSICLLTAASAFSQGLGRQDAVEAPSPAIDYGTAHLSRVVTAIRFDEPITVDGRLDEAAWKKAIPATDFIQKEPRTGELSRERTEVRFLYDDDNLYVGAMLFDSDPEGIVVNSLIRDFPSQGQTDSFTLVLDSLHDRRSGFSFTTNPAGAKRDQQVSTDGQGNVDWDGIWDVKVTRNEEGWIAEYVIPFKTLRFSNAPSQEWGLNMGRQILRLNEDAHWSPLPPRYNVYRVSIAGTLTGLENLRPGRNLTVTPFATAGAVQSRAADGRLETLQALTRLGGYDGGLDLKYSLTPSLTLDATYRTDFAQVEADQQQVNLTRFNLFFPEKRDFFLENGGIFNFGPGGNLVPFFSRRVGLNNGTPVPIVGGSRVSGKVGQYAVGFLAMKTEKLGTAPSNTYLVGRMKRDLFTNSWVGALVTHRDSTLAGDYNRVFGADAHFQFYQRLEFDMYLLGSDTPGRPGSNQARRLQGAWKGDELTLGGEYNAVQRNFNPEVGFIRRGNVSHRAGEVSWAPRLIRSDTIRNLIFGTSLDYYESASTGMLETRTQDATAGIALENNSSITFVTTHTFDRLVSPFQIRSNISIPRGDYPYLTYAARFSTNQSRKIGGDGDIAWGEFWSGTQRSYRAGLTLKPNTHLGLDLTYSHNDVTLATGSFTTNLVGTRFIYGFSPRAFFNAFIQYNADTHQVSSNLRFNLKHGPLSDLYLVYNDRRDTTGGQLLERSSIVKVTNLFSF